MNLEKLVLPHYDYKIHFEDECEVIVASGLTSFGQRVIISILEDDHDNKQYRHYHILVDDKLYKSFINSEVDLLYLFNNTLDSNIYIVTTNYDNIITNITSHKFEDLEKNTIPLENSFI